MEKPTLLTAGVHPCGLANTRKRCRLSHDQGGVVNNINQLTLFDSLETPHSSTVEDALERMALFSESEERGAVFTRSEVVNFILDLVGYVSSKDI